MKTRLAWMANAEGRMGGASIWHWIIAIGVIVATIWPTAIILRRLGFNRGWAILAIIPLLNYVGLIVLARAKWPVEKRTE